MLILIQRLLPLVGAIGLTALVLFLLASLTAPESSARNDGVASSTVEIVELETEPATTTAVITEAEVTSPIPEAKVLKPAPVPSIEEKKTPKNKKPRKRKSRASKTPTHFLRSHSKRSIPMLEQHW